MTTRPTVIVTGAPAAGKSTVCRVLSGVFRRRFARHFTRGIEDCLRSMHAAGRLPGSSVDGNGALVLDDWRSSVPVAARHLLERMNEAEAPALVEIPVLDGWFGEYLTTYRHAEGSMVLYLRATQARRVDRNRRRGGARIPTPNLLEMPSGITGATAADLAAGVRLFVSLDTSGDVGALTRSCERLVEGYLESLPSAALEAAVGGTDGARGDR